MFEPITLQPHWGDRVRDYFGSKPTIQQFLKLFACTCVFGVAVVAIV
jgi:hypothetical protein